MTRTILTHRFRLIMIGLLALSLALATADSNGIDDRARFNAAPQAVLLDTLTVGAIGDLKKDDKRNRTPRIGHPAVALPYHLDLLPPASSRPLPVYGSTRIFPRNDRAGITIRAPPLRRV